MTNPTQEARPSSRRALRADAQREAIMEAALRVVADRGWSAVRVKDVARSAGLSIGGVQHYFDTREELLQEALDFEIKRGARAWASAAAAVEDRDPWGRITAMVERLTNPDRFRERSVLWFEFCVVAARDAQIRKTLAGIFDEWRAPLRAAIDDGVRAGQFTPALPVDDIVTAIVLSTEGLQMAVVLGELAGPRMRDLVLEVTSALLGRA